MAEQLKNQVDQVIKLLDDPTTSDLTLMEIIPGPDFPTGGIICGRQGIADGEPVVVSANFLIDAESNLKAALKGFSEGVKP